MADIHTPIPALKLNDGTSIPLLAYGTGTAWSKRGVPEEQVDRALVDSIKVAISQGWRHFDLAENYRNEVDFGVALKESGVPRSEFYITTKVLPNIDDVDAAIKSSLKKLQIDQLDLYLIHSPWFADEGRDVARLQKAWADVEAVQRAGLTKSIGVSNFLPQHLEAIAAKAQIAPAVNQIEFNPYLQRGDLVAANKKLGIATAAYAPLTPVTRATGGPLDEYLAALAKKYAVNPSEVLLRWAIDQDVIAVTTSSKEQRLSDYLRSTRFKLTPVEIREISSLGEGKHHRAFWAKKFEEDDRS